jgi:hypothetical protein
MTPEDSQTEAEKVVLAPFDLLEGTSESARAKTAETFFELVGALDRITASGEGQGGER